MTYMQEWASFFRAPTQDELRMEVEAMQWLYKRGITPKQIRSLNAVQIQSEDKLIVFTYESKHFVLRRLIPFVNTPLERQINAMLDLKSCWYVFPKMVWTKRKICGPEVPRWTEDELRILLGIKSKRNKTLELKEDKKIVLNLKF